MFAAIDEAICFALETDLRLHRGLESRAVVVNSLPHPKEDAVYQVWVFEGRTMDLGFEYREGEAPQTGGADGTTLYTVALRVRALDNIETLYSRLKQFKANVWSILRELPTGPEDEAPYATAAWGQMRVSSIGAPYGIGKGSTVSGAGQEIVVGIAWEERFTVGE